MNTNEVQDYIFLRAGSLHLLMPQAEMLSVAHVQNRQQASEHAIGSIAELKAQIHNQQPMFAALSSELSILPNIPSDRFIQTTWQQAPELHWCWNEVRLLNDVHLNRSPMPAVIRPPRMPLDGIATLRDGTITFTCETASLLAYLLEEST